MNILDLADAKIYLTRHRRPHWSVRITPYGAMVVCTKNDEALAFINRHHDSPPFPKYIVHTNKGGIYWHRNTLQSALDAVLHEYRRIP